MTYTLEPSVIDVLVLDLEPEFSVFNTSNVPTSEHLIWALYSLYSLLLNNILRNIQCGVEFNQHFR